MPSKPSHLKHNKISKLELKPQNDKYGGKTVSVKVKTGAKQSRVTEDVNGVLKVSVTARPIKGAANDELLKILAYYFKIPQGNISIKTGHTNKNKIISIYLPNN